GLEFLRPPSPSFWHPARQPGPWPPPGTSVPALRRERPRTRRQRPSLRRHDAHHASSWNPLIQGLTQGQPPRCKGKDRRFYHLPGVASNQGGRRGRKEPPTTAGRAISDRDRAI